MTTTSATAQATSTADVSNQSVGELVANLSETTTRLLRHEVALAKTETRAELGVAGNAIGKLAVAGGLALVALTMFSLAVAHWLNGFMDLGWANLIVAALWAVVAWALYTAGRKALRDEVNLVPERTIKTANETPNAVRGR